MATHFICQSTEPLPHNYPTGIPGKSHGAVSQYELYNTGNKPHTRFPAPGWDLSNTSEEDSLPLLQPAPQPQCKNSSFHFDPDLCVTPQRSKVASFREETCKKPEYQPDPDLTLTPQKAYETSQDGEFNYSKGKKNKVRFDLEESVSFSDTNLSGTVAAKGSPDKPYQPELYGDDNDDYDFDKRVSDETGNKTENDCSAKTLKYKVNKFNDKPVYTKVNAKEDCETTSYSHGSKKQLQAKSTSKSKISTKTSSKNIQVVREKEASIPQPSIKSVIKAEKVDNVDHIAVSKMPETTGPKRKVKVLRENQYAAKETEYSLPIDRSEDYAGGDEHMFARPEFNSALRMKLDAEHLKASSIDVTTALQKKLKVSENLKAEINELAASNVMQAGPGFSALVSLDGPVQEICKDVVEQKTVRAKAPKLPKSKVKVHKEPDVMEFFTSDRQKESVSYSLPGISAPSEQLSTATHMRAFDLYKHNRVWGARSLRK